MGRFKLALCAGAALCVVLPAGVLAADYPRPPPYVPPPVEIGHNWYLKGYIGMANQHFSGLSHPGFDDPAFAPVYFEWLDPGNFDAVPLFGVGIGWRHSDHVRFDLTGEYRGKSSFTALDRYDTLGDTDLPLFDGTPGPDWGTNQYTGKKSEFLFLANAYYDIADWHGFTPYVGGGIGASYNSIHDFVDNNVLAGGQASAGEGHQLSLAWALHAGASMQVTNNLTLDFGYSFISLGDAKTGLLENVDPGLACTATGGTCYPVTFRDLISHDFKLSARWSFDKPAAPY